MPGSQAPSRKSPPRERTVVEGNIVEHPIWKLNNRHAKPRRRRKDTGEEYIEPADYEETLDLGPDPRHPNRRRELVIKASVHDGYPTVFAFRVLVVIVEKAHMMGYISQKVPITPTQIANGLGMEEPGGRSYEAIYGALNALENVSLCYVDTYYDVTSRSVHPGRRTERLVKKSVFKLRPLRDQADDAVQGESLTLPGIAAPGTDGISPGTRSAVDQRPQSAEPENYVELGDGLWLSVTSGYRFAVDRPYLNSLPNETTQRLYSYLAKKDYKSRFWSEHVVSIGRRIGLKKTAPSDIRDSLEPACEALKRPLGPEGKVFLRSSRFTGERGRMMLEVETNREQDLDVERLAAEHGIQQLQALKQRFAGKR